MPMNWAQVLISTIHAAPPARMLAVVRELAVLVNPLGILAPVEPANLDLVSWIARLGLPGAMLLDALLLHKLLMPKSTYDEALKQRDARIAERDAIIAELKTGLVALQSSTREEMLPALIKANDLQAQYINLLTDNSRRR